MLSIDDRGSKTRADACNIALERTESEFVFFTDDDVIVPRNWVADLVPEWFEREEVSGSGGTEFCPSRRVDFMATGY